jgi:hypothetical protein
MNAVRVTGRAFFLASPRIALRDRRALAQAVLVESSVRHRGARHERTPCLLL